MERKRRMSFEGEGEGLCKTEREKGRKRRMSFEMEKARA